MQKLFEILPDPIATGRNPAGILKPLSIALSMEKGVISKLEPMGISLLWLLTVAEANRKADNMRLDKRMGDF
jgi:hypothetical protein